LKQKRKRREYRQARKAQFVRPDPGFGMYEGRTRGKRLRYTYSDEEGDDSGSADTNRRSTRNSGAVTPADPLRPTVTASGRQVRSRMGGMYGESLLSGHADTDGASATENYSDASEQPGRPTRASRRGEPNGRSKPRKHIESYNSLDELDDEDEAMSSGHDWDGGDEDDVDDNLVNEDEDELTVTSEDDDMEPKSLIVTLHYRKRGNPQEQATTTAAPDAAQSLPMPVTEAPSIKKDIPVQSTAALPSIPNNIPAQSKPTQAPNGYSALAATGQPTPTLTEIQQEPLNHSHTQPVAAPPGMLAVNPLSATPVAVLNPQQPQFPAHAEFEVKTTAASPAPVSSI
jgi:hypothetical protein